MRDGAGRTWNDVDAPPSRRIPVTDASAPQTGIHVNTSYHVLAFILAFFKPEVSIDGGQPYRVDWGDSFFPAPPGTHRVDVWFNYMIFGACGKGEALVEVPAAGAAAVRYKAPWLVFMAGRMDVVGGAAPAALPGPAAPAPGFAAQPMAQPAPAPAPAPTPAPAAAAPQPAAGGPQWDQARNAYVQFDQASQQWLQFDNATQQWGPLR
jgi:hypothetical protein